MSKFLDAIKEFFIKIIEFIKKGNNKYIITAILSLIVYIILFYVLVGKNQEFHTYSIVTNSIFLVSVVGIALFILIRYDSTQSFQLRFGKALMYSIYVIIGIIFLYFAISFLSGSEYVSDIVSYILQGAIILGVLYMFYLLIKNTDIVKKLRENPTINKIFNFFFLIPRYIYEGSSAFYREIKETPAYVFKILGLQILFITAWVGIPYIKKLLYTHNGTLLLNKPVFTNYEKVVGSSEFLQKYNKNLKEQFVKTKSSLNKELNYKYGLSCWIYIDNQGPNMSATSEELIPLFRYGNTPVISYNSSTHNLQITSQKGLDGTEVIYNTNKIPLQKWNNFIINYDGGKIDIFLNGELIATKAGVVPYVKLDNIIVGSDNGVKGGIVNVMYFDEPLSKIKIDWLYGNFKNSSRPVF